MPRFFRLPLLLCVLVAAAALAGCGGDDEPSSEPRAVLQETFGPDKPIRSGKLQLALDLDLQGLRGLSGPVKARLDGPFQSQGKGKLPDFDFDLDITAGGDTFTAGAVSTGEKGFIELQGQAFDIGEQLYRQFRTGYEQAQKESGGDKEEGPTFEALGIEPLRWLRDPRAAGEEEVGGDETTHITATVDVRRFLDDISRLLDKAEGLQLEGAGKVPGGLSATQRQQIARAVKSARVDIWSGAEDRTLRRLRLAVDVDVPADVRKDVGGLQSGRIGFTFAIAELNEDQEVAAPRNARSFEELQAALGGALGSATTPQQQSQQPQQPGAPGAGAQAPKEYLDCLNEAGSDVAKIQGCAQFLE